MKFLSHLISLFTAPAPPGHEEIEQHVRRLNSLLLTYQQLKTLTVAEWRATEREIEMELQWFDTHRLKLTSTVPTAVQSTDTSNLQSQLPPTHSLSRWAKRHALHLAGKS